MYPSGDIYEFSSISLGIDVCFSVYRCIYISGSILYIFLQNHAFFLHQSILEIGLYQYTSLLVYCGCHAKMLQSGGLKQQKCIVSWFQRLEVSDQGVVGLFLLRALRENLFHAFTLAFGYLLTIFGVPRLGDLFPHLHMVFLVCVCVSPSFPL